ncbi:MAG: D-alanine--D-alanine ligase A [Crocinitomicaceae bacterium]|nr:D-alanine--D-alanine ligase A [Crocinitomicaceae bacterium]
MSTAQNKQRIAVLAGGYSGEAVISLQSAATVMEHLDRNLFDPILVRIDSDRWWADVEGQPTINKSNFTYTQNDIDHSFDAVFIMVHGTPGEDGILQKYFENLSIPFTTGSSESVAETFNKFATTSKLRKAGFTVGNSVILNSNDDADVSNIEENVGFPCFVKPNQGGSSLGISRVDKIEDLKGAIDLAKGTNCESIIIESLLEGREFSMGVVPSEDGTPIAMPITEIVTENLFFDYQAKYEGASDEITPADISEDQKAQIQAKGIAAYKLLGCRGMVRLDYILVDGNKPAILEVNTVPGFSKISILPQQLAHCGISINEMLTRVLNQCSN